MTLTPRNYSYMQFIQRHFYKCKEGNLLNYVLNNTKLISKMLGNNINNYNKHIQK